MRVTGRPGSSNPTLLLALLLGTLLGGLLVTSTTAAHRMRPAIVTITFNSDHTYDAQIALNIEAVLAGIGPQHQDTSDSPNALQYDGLRELSSDALRARILNFAAEYLDGVGIVIDGRRSNPELVFADVPEVGDVTRQRQTTLMLRGDVPADARNFTWSYDQRYGSSAVRVSRAGEDTVQTAFLNAGQTSDPFPIGAPLKPRSTLEIFGNYIVIGFTHIVPLGLDHILFVLGIFLLSVHWRPLLYQVTAFTIAHTITLGLSLYGLISLSPGIVEPLIAISIVYVGVENLLTPRLKPWRVFVVFGFGLLHGMGFAGVLREIGLPDGERLNALIAFNVGVEFGQLTVITLAFLAVGLRFRNRPWYRRRAVMPCSLAIALVGAYWAVERIVG